MTFPFFYRSILDDIMRKGLDEVNYRTGSTIRVHATGPRSFMLDLSNRLLPTMGYRKTHLKTVGAEVAWFLQGTRDATLITKHSPIWDKFVVPDTEPPVIKNAYGYRWRKHFDFDQLMTAIDRLRANPSDRRVYITAWDPTQDWDQSASNVPCPVGFTLSIIGGRLCSAYFLRSSDVFIGLPYDVMAHSIIMNAIATDLSIPLGFLHVTMAHPHIYQAHWGMVEQTLREPLVDTRVELPRWTINQITGRPEEFVQLMDNLGQSVRWPSYNPRPEIIA